MAKHWIKFVVSTILLSLIFACSSDDTDPMGPSMGGDPCDNANVSYANDIVPIVNNACALSGCHVAGFSSGDFTNYAGLKDRADSGRLNARVVVSQNMPPSNSTGPTSLSAQEIEAFECWIAAGAPDN